MPETLERSHTRNWPWVIVRQTWDKALLGTVCEMRQMRNTLYSQGPTRWSSLFSSPLPPEIQPENNSTPPQTSTSGAPPKEKGPLDESPRKRNGPVKSQDIIHQLLANPALYDPVRTPRFPIVLSHGLYGSWTNLIPKHEDVLLVKRPSYTARCGWSRSHCYLCARTAVSYRTLSNNIGIGKLRQQEKDLEELRKSGRDCSLSRVPSLPYFSPSSTHANLTSAYLTQVFNPSTPDDPRVKYWSIAGRINGPNVSIWHPFWLPKMVLDGWEESERVRIKEEGTSQRWQDESEWGNDGLVTIQSAKWGEFLGIMEGCDHWEMRGSRGIEFGVDLPALPAFGLGKSPLPTSTFTRPGPGPSSTSAAQQAQGDGWGFGDWKRLVGAWKRSESDEAAAAAKKAGMEQESELEKDKRREEEAESALKISTDKMSVVFDWLIDRVPAPTTIFPPTLTIAEESTSNPKSPLAEIKHLIECEHKQRAKKRELSTRQDLERFYVALAKRMWDSGL